MTRTELGGKRSRLTLVFLLGMFLAAALTPLYALWAYNRGVLPPMHFLLGPPDDLFGDYFKFILAFPGGEKVSPGSLFGLAEFHVPLPAHNPFLGVEGLPHGKFTHLHGMPLMTLFCIASVAAMAAWGGAGCFLLSYATLGVYWTTMTVRWARYRARGLAWAVAGLLSYPAFFMVIRGNIYAGFTGVLIVHAMLVASRRNAPILAAVLLAVAINIRPNAIFFVLPLALFLWPQIKRAALAFCLAGGGICLASMALAHHFYPDYSPANFLGALGVYYRGYVVGDAGLAYGSSLYGALKLMLGYRPSLDVLALVPSLVILLLGSWAWLTGRLSDLALLFLAAAAYCLGSSVIADYHLLVFILPPIIAADVHDDAMPPALADRIAVTACWLVLVAKNFWYVGDVSYQVVLNPLILLSAGALVLILALRLPAQSWKDGFGRGASMRFNLR